MDREQPVTTPAQEALLHLKNAAAWMSAAAVTDALLVGRAARLTIEAEGLARYLDESAPVAVRLVAPGISRVFVG